MCSLPVTRGEGHPPVVALTEMLEHRPSPGREIGDRIGCTVAGLALHLQRSAALAVQVPVTVHLTRRVTVNAVHPHQNGRRRALRRSVRRSTHARSSAQRAPAVALHIHLAARLMTGRGCLTHPLRAQPDPPTTRLVAGRAHRIVRLADHLVLRGAAGAWLGVGSADWLSPESSYAT